MTLPRRKPKAPKRSTRWRSQKHCNWLRGFVCAYDYSGCCDGQTEVAHVRNGSGAGIGQKPSDWHAVPLCKYHHAAQHVVGEKTFWKIYADRTGQTVEQLIDELCKASPCAAEIRKAREGD